MFCCLLLLMKSVDGKQKYISLNGYGQDVCSYTHNSFAGQDPEIPSPLLHQVRYKYVIERTTYFNIGMYWSLSTLDTSSPWLHMMASLPKTLLSDPHLWLVIYSTVQALRRFRNCRSVFSKEMMRSVSVLVILCDFLGTWDCPEACKYHYVPKRSHSSLPISTNKGVLLCIVHYDYAYAYSVNWIITCWNWSRVHIYLNILDKFALADILLKMLKQERWKLAEADALMREKGIVEWSSVKRSHSPILGRTSPVQVHVQYMHPIGQHLKNASLQ